MKQLCDLPEELILKIINYLEYDDIIMLKKAHEIQSSLIQFNLTNLILRSIQSKIVYINECEEFNCEEAYFNKMYSVGKSLILFKLTTYLHSQIKRLILFNPSFIFDLIDFECLTDFKLILINKFKNSSKLKIRLANLEQFSIDSSITHANLYIILDQTPKLHSLKVKNLQIDQLKIIYPYSIKSLYVTKSGLIINQMKNLEYLELHCFNFSIDNRQYRFDLPINLKTFYFYNTFKDLRSTIQSFRAIREQYPNLRAYYRNIDINSNLSEEDMRKLSYDLIDDASVSIYMNHLDNLSSYMNHRLLDIENLDSISTELIQKLTALEKLTINQVTDQTKWIQILSIPKLTKISISSSNNQEHLNLIPIYCKFLTELSIDGEFENDEWLLQFEFLKKLTINFLPGVEFLRRIIINLNHLTFIKLGESFEFQIINGKVICSFNHEIILKASKASFRLAIQCCDTWGDLFYDSELHLDNNSNFIIIHQDHVDF